MAALEEIKQAISEYACAYQRLNELQRKHSELIPEGDQKTGAVGEFYAKLYVEALYPEATISFGGNSNKAWDIQIAQNGNLRHIQVKTSSAFSKYRKLSPIHHGWHELYILHLNTALQPDGFWVISDNALIDKGQVLRESYGPRPDQHSKKSGKLLFGPNRIDEFRSLISQNNPGLF
ncbi:hypothetical protein [Hymenobacter ruricola]|uniref:DUF4365 domain-containing protein n=1 Tax=Hymenobacter ruricola TaxID=2791023 RepID=A0ABS0I293_9BACT|nr:hypothetical protein [Hymenobacter ruricola]MBF9221030.1 hypothetical protein [Hymenobacter ruricola]